MIKVIITGSTPDTMWYAKHLGEIFEVEKDSQFDNYFKTVKPVHNEQIGHIKKFDCKVMTMSKETLDFGDYVEIEQKRFGVPNEFYRHKVIRSFRSNSYVDVPVQSPRGETIVNHNVVDVVSCICCGVNEVDVRNYRLEDVRMIDSGYPKIAVIDPTPLNQWHKEFE